MFTRVLNNMLRVALGAAVAFWGATAMAGAQCATATVATGGHNGGGFAGGSSSVQQSRLFSSDLNYRRGKSAFSRRTEDGKKIKYCVMVDGKPKKITRARLKQFNGGSVDDFAHGLVDCEQPSALALARVDKAAVPQIVYFLAKRYELDLVLLSPEERLARRTERKLRSAVASAQ